MGDVAVVLVTTTDAGGQTKAYRFLLQRVEAERGGGWDEGMHWPQLAGPGAGEKAKRAH